MALGEFELIRRFFWKRQGRADVALGVGDDCALLCPPLGKQLALTVDTLVEGVHFFAGTNPEHLGHKCLAVNLSDLAAMGARPAWVSLALTLPVADELWLEAFSRGFLQLADQFGVALVGGDTTRGPLSITVQAMGWVDPAQALLRSGAKPGDGIYLTGELGLAGLGLAILQGRSPIDAPGAVGKLERPQPRVQAGLALAGLAHACIDVSDGLAADLGHILEASGVGATLDWASLPLPASVRCHIEAVGDFAMPLHAGDDYELCFSVAADREQELMRVAAGFGCTCSRIGRIDERQGLRLLKDGNIRCLGPEGYQHFGTG